MTTALVFDKVGCTRVLHRLATAEHKGAGQLYARLMGAWGHQPDRERVTLAVTDQDLEVLRSAKVDPTRFDPSVVQSGWRVTYRHPKTGTEVVVCTKDKPPKRRALNVRGGKVRLVAVHVERITNNQEAAVATKTKKKRAVEEDELDELDELEALEDLDDEDEDEEEPDEVEEDEDEEPVAKRTKSKAKKAPAKKKKAVVEDDDEDEDEEDEDEEPAPKRKKGKTRQASAKTKSKSSDSKRTPPAPRELPAGRYSPQDVAEEAGADARAVRVFLRNHADEMGLEKPEGEFRWSFNKKDFTRVVKALKKQRAE